MNKKKTESSPDAFWRYWQSRIFSGERICDECGINIDTPYKDIMTFIHGSCWEEYRKKGKVYPMPAYVGNWVEDQ